ncbi:MAG: type II toxin-antitoxin system VapC family toxin [Phototrophicales bacterium]|nr:type II toxin-antitoxin system VapC family toxin [Phototrophicales bacterium]
MNDAYLLDTNAIIAMMNGKSDITPLIKEATIYLPIITIGELYFGAQNSGRVENNLARVEETHKSYTILYCDDKTARLYGEISAQLSTKGRPIQHNDMWIASLALQYDLILLTQDNDFNHVDTLKRKTW